MATEAGCLSGLSSRTNGTKKFPQALMNVKMNTTDRPGRMSGKTIARRARMADAPSTQAASSRLIGIESMKFLLIQIAIGNAAADMNKIVPNVESTRFKVTNRA